MTLVIPPSGKPLPWHKPVGGLTPEQAKAEMLRAQEPATTYRGGTRVPKHVAQAAPANVTTEIITDAESMVNEPAPQPQPQAIQPAAPTPRAVQPHQPRERQPISTPDFTAEIYYRPQMGYVAEIRYANGTSGTEKFVARDKTELLMKLLAGKANATLKVRSMVVQSREGMQLDREDYLYAKVKEFHNLSPSEFEALPQKSKQVILDVLQAEEIQEFLSNTPEYIGTPHNFKMIGELLKQEKAIISAKNLGWAFSVLKDKLETAARPAAPPPPQPKVVQPPQPKKRGASGLVPGISSAAPSIPQVESSEPNEKQLRSMSIEDLKALQPYRGAR